MDVWAADTVDKPGGLSGILRDLSEAGADLDFIIARRAPDKPGREAGSFARDDLAHIRAGHAGGSGLFREWWNQPGSSRLQV